MLFRILLSVFILGGFSDYIFSQDRIFSGTVFIMTTNQPLNSVSIQDQISLRGTVTDYAGNFKLSLPQGEHRIIFSYTGFERLDTIIYLSDNIEATIYMKPFTVPIGEITVTAEGSKDHVSSPLMGSFTLTNKEMMKLPSLLGETDPLKLLQLTPGVQGGSEGNTGFYVRGGGTDQNLILYDNALVYNPGHLLGFFSIFNPDIIKDVSIIKSGIPAQYGGKLSSVIKMNSYKGNKDSAEVLGSIGLISSRISIGGPVLKGRGTFIIGARKTYLELMVEPLVRHLVKGKVFLNDKSIYDFYDFNAGASLRLTDRDKISFSGYIGRDNFKIGRTGMKQNNSLNWGNDLVSLLWSHKIYDNNVWNTSICWTRYKFDLAGSQSDYFFGLFSSVEDYSVKSDISLKIKKQRITTGLELTEHMFVPNRINAIAGNFILNFEQFKVMNALEGGIFIDDELPVSSKLSIAGGLRISFFDNQGPSRGKAMAFYVNPEPRLVLRYQLNSTSSLKISYMRIAQYIHLATSATASLPTDIWIPSTSGVKPMTGDQVSTGYFRNLPNQGFELSTEVYYKKMHNNLEFLRGIVYNSIYGSMEDNVAAGCGQSYGIEFYLHKKTGSTTGWVSYTLSRTEQKFDAINSGLVYPAKYDRRHEISIVLMQKLGEKWNASAVFIYNSGNAFTMPVGRYIIQGNIVNQYGNVNSFRMPPYHRMDIALNRKIQMGSSWSSVLSFSVYNVYNRANSYFIYFEASGNIDTYSVMVRPVSVSLFPVIPSVSWSFKF